MNDFNENLIAPCGMNCGVCSGHLREKDRCPGCNNGPTLKYCISCKMKNCVEREGKFCFECGKFPCARLKQLDKRYCAKYEMSEIENLEFIREMGLMPFF